MAETSTQTSLRMATLGPAFDLDRIQCMDGTAAKIDTGINQQYPDKEPVNTGEYCLGLMAHSADTERSPAALRERPDKALLAPYKNIALDKGFRPTDSNAAKVLDIFAQVAQQPNADTIGPGRVPIPGSNGKPLVIVPGVALDAGFTSTVLAATNGTPQPTPSMPQAKIIEEAGKCVTNAQQTIEACYEVGIQAARQYLSAPRKVTSR